MEAWQLAKDRCVSSMNGLIGPRDTQGRAVYPAGFDELAKKLDKPLHPPEHNVRCLVSVAMLSEGCDCNTVTHIVGLRPFMSQLLCEQVVGRGLRRASDAPEAGDRLPEKVAKIFGVPFAVIPFKSNPTGPKRRHVIALPERADLEMLPISSIATRWCAIRLLHSLHAQRPATQLPDFIIRLNSIRHNLQERRFLILATKGWYPLEEVKASAAQRWVAAVSADDNHGH